MTIEEIVSLRNELMSRDANRHRMYDVLMAAVGGSYENRRMEGFWQTYTALTGRDIPEDKETVEFNINFIPAILKVKGAMLSPIPSLQVPPSEPVTPDDKTTKETAEKLERVYQGFWNYSHIGKRMNQIGFWGPALGTTIGVVWPDMKNHRPMLQMRSPYGFYPVLADVDGQELSQAIFYTKYKPKQAAAMYPKLASKIANVTGDVTVTQFIDSKKITTIVNDLYVAQDIDNKWGFVPIVIIPNQPFGEGPWGDPDILQVIPVQAEYVYRESLKTAILEQTIMQPLAIEGGDNLPEEIPMGPRDAIPVKMGGRVYRVPPVQVPYQYLQSQNDLIKLIDRVGNIPQVMQGNFGGSVLTGKGVSALQGPTQMAQNVQNNEVYPSIATLNKMAMQMWDAMWPNEDHTVYSIKTGDIAGATVSVETFKTSDFDKWYENIVYVDASSYFDAQSRFVMVLQATQNRLMSRQTAMQFVPGVNDAPGEMALIEAEQQADMDMAQANQARDANNPQPDMAAPGQTAKDLGKGYMGKTPAPEPVGGMAPPKPGESPPAQSTLLQDMIEFFSGLGNLKGKVWLAGGIVTDPSYGPDSPTWTKIEVFLEKLSDKSGINERMRNQFPEFHSQNPFVYHEGEPNPDEPSILVFDPTAGNEPGAQDLGEAMQGETPAQPEETPGMAPAPPTGQPDMSGLGAPQ